MDSVGKGKQHKYFQIALRKLEIKLASGSEKSHDLVWKQLKTHKKYSGDYRAGSNRAAVGFTYPVISGSSVIKAPDRLTALGNANTDRKKYLIYFGNNPDTGNGNVSTVNRICSVVTKDIVMEICTTAMAI